MPPFVYCLNTSTIRPADLRTKIEAAHQAGYAAIELWHDEVDEYLAQGGKLSDVRHMLDDAGLMLASMIYLAGWFETTGTEHEAGLRECRRRMEQAAALGAAICVAGPPTGRADHALGIAHYRELLELGDQIGVVPAIEFLGFVDEFHSLEDAVEVLRATGHPAARVVVDPFHLYRGGSGMEALDKCQLRASEIGILHFNDAPSDLPRETQHDKDRVMPGEGCLDLRQYLRFARDAGYRGPLSLELFSESLWQCDPFEVARIGLEKMRAVAERS